MPEPVITSANICRRIDFPDGPEGPATLVDVAQEIVFMADYTNPVFVAELYLAIEGEAGMYRFGLKWQAEGDQRVFGLNGTMEIEPGGRNSRAALPLNLPCPSDGWYSFAVELNGRERSRQQVSIHRVQS